MDLEQFKDWVLKYFGINLFAYKSNQLHRRILSLMSRIGVDTIDDYVKLLKADKKQQQKFLDFITINVTEFFRNPELFKEFEREIQKYARDKSENIKAWSAACSIGAEPYSMAMIFNNLKNGGKHSILATDIDVTILERAKKGEYVQAEMKNIEKSYIDKYFKLMGNKYVIDTAIKNMVTFKKHDLILEEYEKNFDIIVCRNVVIYFNNEIKEKIYKKFSSSLKKDGLLFVGATESIYNYRDYGFEKASTFIYRKL
ncbi:chemotaxis protein methyltransferase [Clostridium pasteurianum DSM 525 = ATCC 6013]|uniref:protein-glutamate O-methyltransferase n=1 Tax=Clostridium pasteurianum DSM 525 = ATCC 6013 TaxID=1262449 RepID=A0A0H3J9L6_CLOPA|nr:protein-glutamate O-methyltransferase CheR [Clostridium pasteurianum]AJA47830.1 chemotaxis protein methyltransferase [Clostridium pasteurianum DSM 525 = ATCC 6013]AJA51818.1 chemotaxis protein methyltransferase [Clostridium pasteurianum DSM 525 = ATCC 6013]AOZ75121.1 chemotaxis protein CheR [Clostridium pasteurianum DSM 525 = ATCC 6013]AOZ78916.1 chemotaxis protein CheR [Clostridium pasteurianum]ELP59731.1 chemotaxis protein CheR [Clostridium pasteurianum DSM 525 = ATCC 6013]